MSVTAATFAELMPDARILESDEPPMESSLHYLQLMLLYSILSWAWRDRSDYFLAANLTIYFSRQQLKTQEFRGPDLFLVKGVNNSPRRSWVVWEEDGRFPNWIVELLSESTDQYDRGLKKQLYQDRFRTPEYFWFSPYSLEFEGFRLVGGRYETITPTAEGWRWSEELGLYLGVVDRRLRYLSPEGSLLLSPAEYAEVQTAAAQDIAQTAAEAIARAEAAEARNRQLEEQLRLLGVDRPPTSR